MIPYDKVRAVKFKKGFECYKFVIESDSSYSFLINRKETLNTVKSLVQDSGANKFSVMIETKVK